MRGRHRGTLIVILGAFFAIAAMVYYGIGSELLTMLALDVILTVIACIDWNTQTIPPVWNLLLGALGIISYFTMPGPTIPERVIGFFCISLPMFLVVLFVPQGFGGGDIKMMAASGLLLGWKGNVAAFFIALLIGGGYGIYLLAAKKKDRKDHFAFGPFLSLGVALSAFGGLGTRLVELYLSMPGAILAG